MIYKIAIVAALVAAPYFAGPAMAQDAATDPNVTINNSVTAPIPAAATAPPVTVNNNITAPAAPAAPSVSERVTERTNTTTNTTKIVPVPQTQVKTTIVRVPNSPTTVFQGDSNWGLIAILAAIAIIFLGILLAAISGGNTTSSTRRTTVVKS